MDVSRTAASLLPSQAERDEALQAIEKTAQNLQLSEKSH